jgi:uncharacterized RDD family membrane protein YckC
MILAPRSQRLLGQAIDGFIGAVPLVVGVIISSFSDTLGTVVMLGAVGWSIFYYFFADGLHGGQSIGKQWLGMRVVGAESNAPCTFGQSFIRNLLLAVLGPIDWVFIFGERHQRLGDKAAGTIVVSV